METKQTVASPIILQGCSTSKERYVLIVAVPPSSKEVEESNPVRYGLSQHSIRDPAEPPILVTGQITTLLVNAPLSYPYFDRPSIAGFLPGTEKETRRNGRLTPMPRIRPRRRQAIPRAFAIEHKSRAINLIFL